MSNPSIYRNGRVTILRGDARNLPLASGTADLVVTSPPFLNLRSYTDGGKHYDGQIGTGTLDQYLQDLWEVTAEMARVLKPAGSIFVELGDSYTDKSLNDAPFRYAIGCRDKLGLLRRATIIWHHVNGLPESVTDRVRSAHSYVFHFTRQPRYYSAVDEVREAHESPVTFGRRHGGAAFAANGKVASADGTRHTDGHPLGKLPGSVWRESGSEVWEIPSQPLTVPAHLGTDHFAAFPMELPRRIIAGWSPPGICTACGEGRRPVADVLRTPRPTSGPLRGGRNQTIRDGHPGVSENFMRLTTITGYACACPDTTAPTRPAIVLDPFAGTGTTLLVADALGRHGIGVDRSADYCRLARWRVSDPGERAKAMQVPKPPPVAEGQDSLFEVGA